MTWIENFLRIQDEYLQQVNRDKGVVALADLKETEPDLYVWKGDITRLQVGAIVQGGLTEKHEELLKSCYRSCLELAEENGIESIAFCCISTGVFLFPNRRAAELAVQTVKRYKERTNTKIKVIFNIFKDKDEQIYEQLLG